MGGTILKTGSFQPKTIIQQGTNVTKEALPATLNLQETVEKFEKSVGEEKLDPKSLFHAVKEEIIDPLKDFAKEHPEWTTFIGSFAAGVVTGHLSKKKDVSSYMEQLKNNIEKTSEMCDKYARKNERRDLFRGAVALAKKGFIGLSFASAAWLGPGSAVADGLDKSGHPLAAVFACLGPLAISVTSILLLKGMQKTVFTHEAVASNKPSDKYVEGERFLPLGNDKKFITIPPETNKLLYCQIVEDVDTHKLYPKVLNAIDLPDKPTSLSEHEGYQWDNYYWYKTHDLTSYSAKINYADKPNLLTKIKVNLDSKEVSVNTRDLAENQWQEFEDLSKK